MVRQSWLYGQLSGPVAAHFREGGILTRTLSRLKLVVQPP